MQRTVSSSSSPSLKRRAPSLPIDSADPLNALPTDTNDSALKSLGGALETSYKLFWSKVQGVVEPPRTLDDVRKLIGRPFQADETEIKEKPDTASLSRLIVGSGTDKPIDKPINEEQRGNLMYTPLFFN
jgi:hypothetical protein